MPLRTPLEFRAIILTWLITESNSPITCCLAPRARMARDRIHQRSQVTSLKSRLKSWLGSRLKAYSLTSLDTSHDSCPSLGVSHGAGQLDGDLHRDSALNITTELIFVLQIQEIAVTETKSMCWQVFSNKYIYNRLSELEYIVLWTWCVILVITIANSRPGAPMNSDVAIVGSRWRHNCCHWLWVKERHTDKATTRYETYVMTFVATQSSLDDFPLWIGLDLDPDRVSLETRSGSKPSLESSLKSRLLVNMAPELGPFGPSKPASMLSG